jgi:acetyl esterase/lipase
MAQVLLLAATLIARGVAYAHDGGPDQVMDLFWTAKTPIATVLFIHGGSLQESGERRNSPAYAHVCTPFVAAGIACASMDYRLAPRHSWPAMPDDVAAAILHLREIISQRGGDPHRLFLFGHSSGGHLAAIVGTNPEYLQRAGLSTKDLAGVIAMGCSLDRNDAAARGLTAEQIRAPFSRDREDVATFVSAENWLAANPASYVGNHVPPTLVIVAESERFMPPILEQGARFVRQLLEVNVPADLVIVPGRHMGSIASIGKRADPTFAAITKFIRDPAMRSDDSPRAMSPAVHEEHFHR